MPYYPMSKYKFVKFQKSTNKKKKYDAILENKKTGKTVKVPFGASSYEQYKDKTGLGLYSNKDHNDPQRRKNYKSRHQGFIKKGQYSPGYFSMKYLW